MIVLQRPRNLMTVDEKAGFTLIEVSLAVLVVGLGLLAVFSLFPSGLRSAEEGAADTHAGLFAETVMTGLRGNAATITNWDDWCDASFFCSHVRTDVLKTGLMETGKVTAVPFPKDGGQPLRYRLTLNTANSNEYGALLEVCNGQSGAFDKQAVFYTEFIYQGM